jgi:sugar phosphate isomerase/epimerase
MLRNTALLGGAALFGSQLAETASADEVAENKDLIYATILGWKIGPQIYSFKNFPFDEAVKKVRACGVSSFELYSGQRLTRDSEDKVGPGMSKDAFKKFRDLLAANECVPHAMGVTGYDRAHFDFAASLGISVLNIEPGFDKIAGVNELAEEYKINVGLHNHPKPSIYWDPQIVLDHLKDTSTRIGACCDTGHWLRSNLNPLECIQKFKGRISSFHIKDLKKNAAGNYGGADVPLGQGEVGIAEILKECAAQRVRCPFSIEYEANWDNNQPLVAEGIKFFVETAKSIVLEA